MQEIVPLIFLFFLITGVVYGYAPGPSIPTRTSSRG